MKTDLTIADRALLLEAISSTRLVDVVESLLAAGQKETLGDVLQAWSVVAFVLDQGTPERVPPGALLVAARVLPLHVLDTPDPETLPRLVRAIREVSQ